jgi:predicted CoA-binding protein
MIGASSQESKWGFIMLKILIDCGYRGKVFPINPKGGEILGWKVYPTLVDVEVWATIEREPKVTRVVPCKLR